MVYTCQPVPAPSCTPRHRAAGGAAAELHAAARAIAAEIAAKDPQVIRMAKESLNGIDPVDVRRSYRFEQGFTFELNLTGRRHGPGTFVGGQRWRRR